MIVCPTLRSGFFRACPECSEEQRNAEFLRDKPTHKNEHQMNHVVTSRCGISARLIFACTSAVLGAAFVAPQAFAQWTVQSLLPPGMTECRAFAADAGEQSGWVRVGLAQAELWNGSSSTWVNINPSGGVTSTVYGARAGQQVGFFRRTNTGVRA